MKNEGESHEKILKKHIFEHKIWRDRVENLLFKNNSLKEEEKKVLFDENRVEEGIISKDRLIMSIRWTLFKRSFLLSILDDPRFYLIRMI